MKKENWDTIEVTSVHDSEGGLAGDCTDDCADSWTDDWTDDCANDLLGLNHGIVHTDLSCMHALRTHQYSVAADLVDFLSTVANRNGWFYTVAKRCRSGGGAGRDPASSH